MKPLKFFLLVFALTIPFYLIGALTSFQIIPGILLSGLAVLCPMIAAMIIEYRDNGSGGLTELLKRSLDYKRVKSKIWYAPLLLLMPCVMILSYFTMRYEGILIPAAQFSLVKTLFLFFGLLVPALCEELGWSGYVINPLQHHFGALLGSILLGVIWAIWHFIPLIEIHRSWNFIAWWSLGTVASRIIIVWLFNNTGKSVFVATIFHTMINVTWQLFPINGSYYDPRITSLILIFVTVIIVMVWGQKTLTRKDLHKV